MIEVSGFTMRFGAKTAVDDLSFSVARGETFGFLGGNGSGKTTTIRALLGAYEPTAGELLVDGRRYSPRSAAVLGYLPEERGVYPKERVIDVMTYGGCLKGLRRKEARAQSLAYLERVGIADKATSRVEKLSGGQQQKVQLGITMLNDPQLLILDEPTKGLDPVNRRLLVDLVEERRRAGATVVLVTHHMEEAERLCDRILLLKDGRAVAHGTVDEVTAGFRGTTFELEHRGALPRDAGYEVVRDDGRTALVRVARAGDAAEVVRSLVLAGVAVERFQPSRTTLDEVFVRLYSETVDEDERSLVGG